MSIHTHVMCMYVNIYISIIYIYVHRGTVGYIAYTHVQTRSRAEINDIDVLPPGTVGFEIEEKLAFKVLCPRLNHLCLPKDMIVLWYIGILYFVAYHIHIKP